MQAASEVEWRPGSVSSAGSEEGAIPKRTSKGKRRREVGGTGVESRNYSRYLGRRDGELAGVVVPGAIAGAASVVGGGERARRVLLRETPGAHAPHGWRSTARGAGTVANQVDRTEAAGIGGVELWEVGRWGVAGRGGGKWLFALSYSEAKDEEEDDDAVSVVVAVAGLNADINYMFAYSTKCI
jgi:hypothetical protein